MGDHEVIILVKIEGKMLQTFRGTLPDVGAVRNIQTGEMTGAPFGDLTRLLNDQNKLLNDQSKLTKLCEQMMGEVAKLREEFGSLKENISTLSSKADAKPRSRSKLPKDLSVSQL